MTVSVWQDRSHRAEEHADVVVLGAGFSGAACAYWLAREGLGVAVVDGGAPGAGASGRGLGVLWSLAPEPYAPWGDRLGRSLARRAAEASREGLALLGRHLVGEAGHRVGLEALGAAFLGMDPAAASGLERSARGLAEDGLPGEVIRIPDLTPWPEGLPGWALPEGLPPRVGLLDPEALVLDPLRLVEVALEEAVTRGARIYPHQEVFRLVPGPRGVEIQAQGLTLRAEVVVACLGGAGRGLLPGPSPRLADGVRSSWLLPAIAGPALPWPARLWPSGLGLRRLPEGGLLLSALGTGAVAAGDPQGGPDAGPDAGPVERRWREDLALAPDGLPLVGGTPAHGVYYLVGGTDAQWGLTFLAAQRLATWVVEGRAPEGVLREGREA